MGIETFKDDLYFVRDKLVAGLDDNEIERLDSILGRLIELKTKRQIKINHSVLELVCSKELIMQGYDVDVEHPLINDLVCDLYGTKGDGVLIVEIETGFTEPAHARDPNTYANSRIASKIARYSGFAGKFVLATPKGYIMKVPPLFVESPRLRKKPKINEIKKLCGLYYKNPLVSKNEIRNGRLHAVYIIDVDNGAVKQIGPTEYINAVSSLGLLEF